MDPLVIGAGVVAAATALYQVLKPDEEPQEAPPAPPPPAPVQYTAPAQQGGCVNYPCPPTGDLVPRSWIAPGAYPPPPPTPTTPETSAVGWEPEAMESPPMGPDIPTVDPRFPSTDTPIEPVQIESDLPIQYPPLPTTPPPTPTEPVEEAEPEESCYQCSPGAVIQMMTAEEAAAYSGICVETPEAYCQDRPSIPTIPGGIPLETPTGGQAYTMGFFGRRGFWG